MGLELESLSGSGNWSLHSAVGQSELWRIGITAIPDDQITCPPVLVGFGLLQGLVTTLLIRQVTETLTIYAYTLFIIFAYPFNSSDIR